MNGRSYLCLAGTEIANEVRTLSYLLRGLAGSGFEVATNGAADPASLVSGYSDIYSDIYTADVSFASVLACYCSDLDDPSNFVSPAADHAPWYDSTIPASGEFFGVGLETVDLGPTQLRAVTARSSGGGSMGRLRAKPRTMQFAGHMYASTPRGMAYGERWLNMVLAGSMCEAEGGDTAEVLPACGDGATGAASGFRTLYEVGLVDGPVFTPILGHGGPGHRMQQVAWQLVAANPYLHRQYGSAPTVIPLTTAGAYVSVPISTTEWGGEVAVTLDIEAVGDLTSMEIAARPMIPGDDCTYNPALTVNTCAAYIVNHLDNGNILTIDATSRRVSEWDDTSKSSKSGFDALVFASPFPWIIVPPCSMVCVTLRLAGTGHANVTVTAEAREL